MKQYFAIILTENISDTPEQYLIRDNAGGLFISLCPRNGNTPEQRYALIRRQDDYLMVSLDRILWIEASGSYSIVRLADGRSLTVSFNLSVIKKALPTDDFIRIHRSYIINLKHVESMIGNSLRIGGKLLPIDSLRLSNAFPCQGGYVYFYTVGSQASPGDCRMSGYTLL